MKFSIRDLLWLIVVVALLVVVVGLVVCWRMDHWTSEYTHQMFMRMKDGEIKQLKEQLKKSGLPIEGYSGPVSDRAMPNSQAPAPNPPKE